MSKKLVDYIKAQLQKGYDISSIKQVTSKYGYSQKEIESAINEIYHPTVRHEIHLGKTTVFVVILLLAALFAGGFYFLKPKAKPATLLDLDLEPVTSSAGQGQSITFIKEVKNLGSSERYDIILTYELIDQISLKVISQESETIAIETSTSSKTSFKIPDDAASGDYILRAIAEYDNKKAIATIPIKVTASLQKDKETCHDGIKNQDEAEIDCGGICAECKQENKTEESPVECSDNNPCTEDAVKDGKCSYAPIQPCCGNGICEENDCELDCNDDPDLELSIEQLKSLAATDPSRAQQLCNKFEVPDLKDTCISNIAEVQSNKNYCNLVVNLRLKDVCFLNLAKKLKDNSLCGDIAGDGRRDSCYMTFVTDYKEYSVCPRITNSALRQSCEYLKQIYSINQNGQQQQNSTQSSATETMQ